LSFTFLPQLVQKQVSKVEIKAQPNKPLQAAATGLFTNLFFKSKKEESCTKTKKENKF